MAGIPPGGYRQRAVALAHADESAVLPRVAVPTLVIWGDADSVLPRTDSEALQQGIRTPSSLCCGAPAMPAIRSARRSSTPWCADSGARTEQNREQPWSSRERPAPPIEPLAQAATPQRPN